jgi:hypothetical protein
MGVGCAVEEQGCTRQLGGHEAGHLRGVANPLGWLDRVLKSRRYTIEFLIGPRAP